MSVIVRMLVVLALAVFAAGSVAHAAGSTAMAVEMAAVESGTMDMTDCDPCGGEEEAGALACDPACSTGGFAVLATSRGSEVVLTLPGERLRGLGIQFSGFSHPPLKHPPRLIL